MSDKRFYICKNGKKSNVCFSFKDLNPATTEQALQLLLNTVLTSIKADLTKIQTTLTNIETKLTNIETEVTDIETKLTNIETEFTDIKTVLQSLDTKLDLVLKSETE
jgi:predicted  nucleic acid-binding Zn-ribbon protein